MAEIHVNQEPTGHPHHTPEETYGQDVHSNPVNDHDWSWLILPALVFLLCVPALLPTAGSWTASQEAAQGTPGSANLAAEPNTAVQGQDLQATTYSFQGAVWVPQGQARSIPDAEMRVLGTTDSGQTVYARSGGGGGAGAQGEAFLKQGPNSYVPIAKRTVD